MILYAFFNLCAFYLHGKSRQRGDKTEEEKREKEENRRR